MILKQKIYKPFKHATMEKELIPTKLQLPDDLGNDLLADVSVSNLMQEMTTKLANDIEQKRNKVITERLKEIVGIDLNIEEEAKRRFKRFAIEYNGNEEIIYFNDGSEQGKRIVTFVRDEQPLSFEFDKCEMRVGYSYY
jgi:hypothetical protein